MPEMIISVGFGQAMVMRGTTGSGWQDNLYGSGAWAFGGLGGFGIDGFVNPYVSAGVEVGGMAALAMGAPRADSADRNDSRLQVTALTTFASAQLTVWK